MLQFGDKKQTGSSQAERKFFRSMDINEHRQGHFSAFYEGVHGQMLAYALHFTRNDWHKAVDAVQDISLDLWRAWSRNPTGKYHNGYLWTCVKNYFARGTSIQKKFEASVRHLEGEESVPDEYLQYLAEDPAQAALGERIERIESFRGKMPDRLIRVAKSIATYPKDPKRAAQDLGYSEETFRSACKAMRRWHRDENAKYEQWCDLFSSLVGMFSLSEGVVAHSLGRLRITREETHYFLADYYAEEGIAFVSGVPRLDRARITMLRYPIATIAAHNSHHMTRHEVYQIYYAAFMGLDDDIGTVGKPEWNHVYKAWYVIQLLLRRHQPGLYRALSQDIEAWLAALRDVPRDEDVTVID